MTTDDVRAKKAAYMRIFNARVSAEAKKLGVTVSAYRTLKNPTRKIGGPFGNACAARPWPERLWKKIDKRQPEECWPWLGANSVGYGYIYHNGKHRRVTRVMWEMENNTLIPEGLVVRHKCDNPICCNPAHLEIGTHKDNVADSIVRGRCKRAPGEQNARARLTETQVKAIRSALAGGDRPSVVAARLGVSDSMVESARKGWKHIK